MKAGTAGTMGTLGTQLHSVNIQEDAAPLGKHTQQECSTPLPLWKDYLANAEKQAKARSSQRLVRDNPAMQHWQEARAARIEALRAEVQAGTYQIDSMAIAERLLEGYRRTP